MFRSSIALIATLAVIGVAHSEASEVSEVTTQPPQPAQMRIAHNFEYAPTAVSDVTVPGGAQARSSQVVLASEPVLVAGTVSEVTIQPGREVAARREAKRTGKSLAAGDPSIGSSPVRKK